MKKIEDPWPMCLHNKGEAFNASCCSHPGSVYTTMSRMLAWWSGDLTTYPPPRPIVLKQCMPVYVWHYDFLHCIIGCWDQQPLQKEWDKNLELLLPTFLCRISIWLACWWLQGRDRTLGLPAMLCLLGRPTQFPVLIRIYILTQMKLFYLKWQKIIRNTKPEFNHALLILYPFWQGTCSFPIVYLLESTVESPILSIQRDFQ